MYGIYHPRLKAWAAVERRLALSASSCPLLQGV
jgi:hypothetical protein